MITMKRVGVTSYIALINGKPVNLDRYYSDADMQFHIRVIKTHKPKKGK